MKIYTPVTEKKNKIAIKIDQEYSDTIRVNLVDAETGEHLKVLLDINDSGIIVYEMAKPSSKYFEIPSNLFDSDGRLNIIKR